MMTVSFGYIREQAFVSQVGLPFGSLYFPWLARIALTKLALVYHILLSSRCHHKNCFIFVPDTGSALT